MAKNRCKINRNTDKFFLTLFQPCELSLMPCIRSRNLPIRP